MLNKELPLECFNANTIVNSSSRYTKELNITIQRVAQQFIIGSGWFWTYVLSTNVHSQNSVGFNLS